MIEPILKPKHRKRVKPPIVMVMPDGKERCASTPAGLKEYRRRTLEMRTRQKEICRWCGKWLSEEDATFDHEEGRAAGRRDDRLFANGREQNASLHYVCNGLRGSTRAPYPF